VAMSAARTTAAKNFISELYCYTTLNDPFIPLVK
jgi:hypothetical protein